jgi:hypothetical protein
MIKCFFILAIAVFFISCDSNKKKGGGKPPDVTQQKPKVDTCTFGLDTNQMNTLQRRPPKDVLERQRGKKVKNPPPLPPQQPTYTQGTPTCILLDFDGHVVSGTSWNYAGDIVAAPSGMLIDEQQIAVDTLRARYSQFKSIYITTDEAVWNTYPTDRRARVIVTETWQWFGQAGGVAFIGGLRLQGQNTAFVFDILLNYDLKFVYEAAAHETGHLFGLNHQAQWENGVKISDYWGGPPGENWAPIMGVGYYRNYVRFIIGMNSNGVLQNDTLNIRTALK